MNNNAKYNKTEFIRFVMSTIEHNSSDKEKSREYLSSQGLNVDAIVSDGLKRINKIQMQVEADKTRLEMASSETIKQRANEWVEKLLNSIDFSLEILVKEEKLTVCFSNLKKLDKDDIKKILVKHFTLKFIEEQNK